MNRKWNDAELNYIKDNAATMKDKDLLVKLAEFTNGTRRISLQSLRKIRQRLGLKKVSGRGYCGLYTEEKPVEVKEN